MMPEQRLLLVVSDGVRPDVLREEIDAGRVPTLAALRARGGLHEVTTSFPSVTGPAYVPFLMGRHPSRVGLPGLRWFDRARTLRWARAQTRSYAGIDIWHVDRDVQRDAPTLFELARPSLAAMSMLGRGASHGHVGRSVLWMIRAAPVHFGGNVRAWRALEQSATRDFLNRFARIRPKASVIALTSPDKFAHAFGSRADVVRTAILDLDALVRQALEIARRGGWDDGLHVWMVGDHGHQPVTHHDDLHGWLDAQGLRTLAHPSLGVRNPDVVLMVGGNAMAHLYLTPSERQRRWWPEHAPQSQRLLESLLLRESTDLLATAESADVVHLWSARHGMAEIRRSGTGPSMRWSYLPCSGDPLQLGGALRALDLSSAWQATRDTRYPDAIVQVSDLVPA
ncbi:MAG: alkaline phosphatase family protein, partial [Gemmatimonadaceae bacterium]